MEPYRGIYLYTDLDDTLLRDDKTVSDTDYAALQRFTAGGGRFGIATGRPVVHIARFRDRLPINAPCVLCNGAAVYDFDTGRYVRQFPLPVAPAMEVIRQMLALLPEISIQIFTEQHIYMVNPNQRDDLYIIWDHLERIHCMPEAVTEPWLKILFCHHGDRLDWAVPQLRIDPALVSYRSELTYFELLAMSKGNALQAMRPALPGLRQLLTIGDYENDVDLVRNGDIGAAPENALPCVRAAADLIVADHNHNAVADFLERTVFSKQTEKGLES